MPPASSPDLDDRAWRREANAAKAEARVDTLLGGLRRSGRHVVGSLRFLLFFFYTLLAVLAFWLWFFAALFVILRVLLTVVMTPLLWLADGTPRGPRGVPRGVAGATADAARRRFGYGYADGFRVSTARHLARLMYDARQAGRRFWHLGFGRKLLVAVLSFFFVFVPLLYVVPRPHEVQIVDDNAIHHEGEGTRVRYVIHGVDMHKRGQTREYENEQAWWLLKLNTQGMKNRIHPGRYYRFWVVGIRWYLPQLFPNIIAIQELDAEGRRLEHPSHFVPSTTTGS